MCGRYTGYIDDCDEMKTIYTIAESAWPKTVFQSGEIYPTNTVPILVSTDQAVRVVPGYWGFPGFKGSSVMINARSETVDQRPTFADSFLWRRCVVPTTGYFEWDRQKRKYLFNHPERKMLFLAGLYKVAAEQVQFVILTTAANESVAEVHHRMPVILDSSELYRWNTDRQFAMTCINRKMPDLCRKEA